MVDRSHFRHRAFAVLLAALILAVGASRFVTLPLHIGLDANEGWNAFQAVRAMGAGPLYPPSDAMIGNNYPPLSFLVVGTLGKVIGDPIIAGRLLALLSVAGIAVLLFLILRRLGQAATASLVGAGLFLLLNATVLRAYLAMDDPQWFGHLLMTAAVLTLLPRQRDRSPSPAQVVGAAALVICGGLVKQNLVAWPLAMSAWLALHHRRSLLPWLATLAVGGGIALAWCSFEFGPEFIRNLAGVPRTYSFSRMVGHALVPTLLTIPALVYCWPLRKARGDDSRLDLILLAIAFAVPIGIFERSGAGVDINAHFEAAIALCLACPVAAGVVRDKVRDGMAAFLLFGLLVAGFVLEGIELSTLHARQEAWAEMEPRIAATPGRVACETQALCFWAGKAFEIDFFLYAERIRASGDTHLLDRALEQRRFAAIQLNPPRKARAGGNETLTDYIRGKTTVGFTDSQGRQLLVFRQAAQPIPMAGGTSPGLVAGAAADREYR